MASGGSTQIVVIALAAQAVVTCAKFAAYVLTGSSAMLAQAVHALAATANQGLLLYGQARPRPPRDARYPFGAAPALYFWSYVVAILLFALAAGVSILEGLHAIARPRPIEAAYLAYIVLGATLIWQVVAVVAALRAARAADATMASARSLPRTPHDPALAMLLLQNAAGLAGGSIALTGVVASDFGGVSHADGVAAILIGLLLASVAVTMALAVKGLIAGEAAPLGMHNAIRDIVVSDIQHQQVIHAIDEIKTLRIAARAILVTVSATFKETASAGDVAGTAQRLQAAVRTSFPDVVAVHIEVQSAAGSSMPKASG